jgi:hypothetical protein
MTDKGNKRFIHYKSQQQLALSHGWREYAANKGYRCVERFLVTREGERWIEKEGGFFTVSDFWENKKWPEEKKKRMDGYSQLGKIIGCIHSYFEGIEEEKMLEVKRKGRLARIRFQNLYDFFHKIPVDIKKNLAPETGRLLIRNLPLIAERVHQSELFYERCLDQVGIYSFSHIPLESFIYHKDCWYLTGLHLPQFIAIHEDTFSLMFQIFSQEDGDLKGVETFLTGYLAERELPRKEWDFIFAMAVFPWETIDKLYVLLHNSNLKEITPEQLTAIFKKQMDQETILQFLAHWADLRGRVSY